MGKKEKTLKGVIFDLDGVLVNTVPLHFKAWKKMFSEYGKKFTFKDYREKVDGISRLDGAKAILDNFSDKELEIATIKKQRYYLEYIKKKGVKVYKDALDLIERLKKNKIKIGVISSSKNCLIILKRSGLDKEIDAKVDGNDIKKGKPDPEIFLVALKRLGLKKQECIVFEDAILGIEAAKKAKIKCIGVDRYRKSERLIQADLVVNTLKEVNLERLKPFFK